MCRISMCLLCLGSWTLLAKEPTIVQLWPDKPPGETKELPPEVDTWKDTDKFVGDRKIQKITNVSKPTLAIYRPETKIDTGAAVIVAPGGGHHILAYDHEGTEAAEWLAKNGVTGIVLKYRVPFRDANQALARGRAGCPEGRPRRSRSREGLGDRSEAHRHARLLRGRPGRGDHGDSTRAHVLSRRRHS